MERRSRLRRFLYGLVGGLVGLLLAAADVGTGLDLAVFDALQRGVLPRPETRVVIVRVDPVTVENLGWPMPKELFAAVIQQLDGAGARRVGVDMFLTDREIPVDSDGSSESRPVSGETLLGQVARAAGAVFASYRITVLSATKTALQPSPSGIRIPCPDRDPTSYLKPLLPGLREREVAVGHVHWIPSQDGVYRSIEPCVRVHDGCIPDFATLVTGSPVDAQRCSEPEFVPHFRRLEDFPGLSMARLIALTGDAPGLQELRRLVKDRYVLIGLTDPTLSDIGATALASQEPLVTLHANRIDALLSGIRIAELSAIFPMGISIVLLIVVIASLSRAYAFSVAAAISLMVAGGASVVAFRTGYLWLAPSKLLLPFLLGTVAAGSHAAWEYFLFNRTLTQAFERYVAPEVLQWLRETGARVLHPDAAEHREITVLFSDVAGYTGLSNVLRPDQVMASLRFYLDSMVTIALSYGGFVDKIMGDGIMVLFNAPKQLPGYAERAVTCAAAMQDRVAEIQQRWRELTGSELQIRIGVATGDAFVGNLGGEAHVEYSAIGRAVNLASRLEHRCQKGGILICEATHQRLAAKPPGDWREVELKGYEDLMRAWQIPAGNGKPETGER